MRKRVNKTQEKLEHLEQYYRNMLNCTLPENYCWKSKLENKTVTLTDPDGGIITITYRKTKWGDAYLINLYGREIDYTGPGASFGVYMKINTSWRKLTNPLGG